MITAFRQFWEKHQLSAAEQTCLLAVSGGMDSMALAQVFLQEGWSFGLAHCNFQLRGAESDGDAAFVEQFAQKHQIPFFTISFPTSEYATQHHLSIQEAARNLRYEWLEKIRQAKKYHWIATAHHLNDSIETTIYNLSKGSGIRGLHGIPAVQGKIIRPLSDLSRAEIADFVKQQDLDYREDSSNKEEKYRRNLLRHQVIPVLKDINPGLEKTFRDNLKRLRETEWLYQYAVDQWAEKLLQKEGSHLMIDLEGLTPLPVRDSLLYEWLHPYGFSAAQLAQVFEGGATESGRLFYSASHQLLIDRQRLLLEPLAEAGAVRVLEKEEARVSTPEGVLSWQLLSAPPSHFSGEASVAYLDARALAFPLRLRHWRAGDQFQPLGMGGRHQKLQDFFSNAKLSRFAKEKVALLESGGQICWVVGWRIDERFKVQDDSGAVWKFSWQGLKPS